ncbi:MAG: nucleotidyltransferase domain-containing protein [Nitrospira sp.]|nr:nucleotidyltransferase domain-containing protein [Nitrospira sp.]
MMPQTPPPQTTSCILKVLVGSHAHGLAGPESDQDFRSVYMRIKEEAADETAWEIDHFLQLGCRDIRSRWKPWSPPW